MEFKGIYTPAITPFLDSGQIDYDGTATVIEHLISSGVDGIILAGTTGEYYAMTSEERIEMMPKVKAMIEGRVPLIVGTGAIRTEDAVVFAEAAAKHGADGLLVATPPYALPTEQELAVHALTIDRAANLPIMLYNYPGRMGAMMGEEFLDLISASSNFCAIKESSGDINRLHLLANGYPNIQLSCGMDDQALEFFAWGAKSWVCAGSNFAPEAHIALYKACVDEGDFNKGRQIMSAMMPLMTVLEQGGKFIQCIKQGMDLRGLPGGQPRKPLLGMTEEEQLALADAIEQMNAKINAIVSDD
ncbi:MAG: dihydrodipicolinate synthase family protein [Gammaproteobacteria bacterium]|nr:dihydrodipicolinate synthase family protein [Gammaproteobacteria bacterium]